MAAIGIQLSAEIANLSEVQKALGNLFTPTQKAQVLKAALTKAIEPAFLKLKQVAPVGPTGNLRRAVTKRVVAYPKDGNAVGLVGFRRAAIAASESAAGGSVEKGPDRARHQYWLEEGTSQRAIKAASPPKSYNRPSYIKPGFERRTYQMTRKGKRFTVSGHSVSTHPVSAHVVNDPNSYYYASSYRRLGKFKILKFRAGEKGFITDPAYPNAFFRKSKNPIVIDPMPAGGFNRNPPLATTFEATKAQMGEILSRELRLSLEQALSTVIQSASRGVG